MRTTVTRRGQTVIPAKLRGRYHMDEGTQIEWLDTGVGLKVIPSCPTPSPPCAAAGVART